MGGLEKRLDVALQYSRMAWGAVPAGGGIPGGVPPMAMTPPPGLSLCIRTVCFCFYHTTLIHVHNRKAHLVLEADWAGQDSLGSGRRLHAQMCAAENTAGTLLP